MPASRYKIWAWGAPVGVGATQSVHVGLAAIAKKATARQPHIIGNELVCNLLARILMLPCPPGALLDNNGETYFCSLNFNTAGQSLPPASPGLIVGTYPELSWGITLFDILVMNPDRHNGNISYDAKTKEVTIFDHSHAFLRPNGPVDSTLSDNKDKLAIGGHCLAAELNTWNGFNAWVAKIRAIPNFCIEGAIEAACKVGIPQGKLNIIRDFMVSRRDAIDTIVTNNKQLFPKLPATGP